MTNDTRSGSNVAQAFRPACGDERGPWRAGARAPMLASEGGSCLAVARPLSRASEGGFTLVELAVSMFIMLVVTGAVFGLVDPSQGIYRAQPEVSDMQQRLRVSANTLQQDLMMAGAGSYLGGSGGSLLNFFAPIQPLRLGTENSDIDADVFFRPDAITIMYVPQTAAQTTIVHPMPSTSSEIRVDSVRPGCPTNQTANEPCGFKTGTRVVIFDDTGAFDPFTITHVQNSDHLQHNLDDFSKKYESGSQVTAVAMSTYYLVTDPSTNTFQMRYYDGFQTDVPMVDNVVAMEFEYLGDPHGPVLLKPVTSTPGPWTTYGPKPPALGVDRLEDSWDAGENCAFKIDPASGLQVSRLPDIATVAGAEGLVRLTQEMLTTGPKCPDDASSTRFDADLLRVRTVEVRLRVQVASATMRGPAGALFTRGGSSKGGMSFVPDHEVRFAVSPRNMNLGR